MILDFLFMFVVANIATEAIWPAIGVPLATAETFVILGLIRLLGIKLELYRHRPKGTEDIEQGINAVTQSISNLTEYVSNVVLVIYKGNTTRNVFIMVCTLIAMIFLQQV